MMKVCGDSISDPSNKDFHEHFNAQPIIQAPKQRMRGFLFICSSFHDAFFSNWDYITSNKRVMSEW
jgi:hypothetical protein